VGLVLIGSGELVEATDPAGSCVGVSGHLVAMVQEHLASGGESPGAAEVRYVHLAFSPIFQRRGQIQAWVCTGRVPSLPVHGGVSVIIVLYIS